MSFLEKVKFRLKHGNFSATAYANVGIYNDEEILKSNLIHTISAKLTRYKSGEPIHSVGDDPIKRSGEKEFKNYFGISADYVVKEIIKTNTVPYLPWCDNKANGIDDYGTLKYKEWSIAHRVECWAALLKLIPKAEEEELKEKRELERQMAEKVCRKKESELQKEKERLALTQGGVYILSNPSMPGIVKIGFTSRHFEERIKELNSHTGVPTPFKCEAFLPCCDPHSIEQRAHRLLSEYRISQGREFFKVSPGYATKIIVSAMPK